MQAIIAFIILIASLMPNLGYAAKAKRLSLREAILLALRYNPVIKNAEIDRVTQKFNLLLAFHEFEWRYTLTGDASYTRLKSGVNFKQDVHNYELAVGGSRKFSLGTKTKVTANNNFNDDGYNPKLILELDQPLLQGAGKFLTQNNLNNALDDEQTNKLNLRGSITGAIRKVISDYRVLIQKNNSVKIARSALRDARKTYHDNEEQIKQGRLPKTINYQHETQLESLKLSLAQVTNDQKRSQQILLEDLGMDPDMKIVVPNNVHLKKLEVPNLNKTIASALTQNIPYQKALITLEKSERALFVAKDKLKPKLDLQARATIGGGVTGGLNSGLKNFFDLENQSQTIQLTLDVPVDRLPINAEIASQDVQIEKDKINIAQERRRLVTEIKNQVTDIKSQIKQIKIARQFVKVAGKNYKLEKLKQLVGRSTSLDVTNSQDALIREEFELTSSKISYLEAMSNLRVLLNTTLSKWHIRLKD